MIRPPLNCTSPNGSTMSFFTWENVENFLSSKNLRQLFGFPTIELYEFLAYVLRDCLRKDARIENGASRNMRLLLMPTNRRLLKNSSPYSRNGRLRILFWQTTYNPISLRLSNAVSIHLRSESVYLYLTITAEDQA